MSDGIKPWESLKSNKPEEKVRSELLQTMEKLGYPKNLLLVEKQLTALPHITGVELHRRFDIICLAKELHPEHPFYPLLLVECKAHQIDQKTASQVIGYNRVVKSIFIGIASREQFYLGRYDFTKEEYLFSAGLPSFNMLYEEARLCFTKT